MKIWKSVFVLPLLALAPGIGRASPVAGIPISGTTMGCFGVGCTPVASDVFGGLTFTGGSFSGLTDSNGEFAPGVTGNNLGTFMLGGTAFNYGSFAAPTLFTLELILNNPAPGNAPAGMMFTGDVTGVVDSATNGTVSVTWPGICHGCGAPPAPLYTFSTGQGTGTIAVHINPHSFSLAADAPAPQDVIQDGHFHTDVVPEPGTYALAGGALAGLIFLKRRFRG